MNAIDNGFVGRLVDVESGNDKVVVEICQYDIKLRVVVKSK